MYSILMTAVGVVCGVTVQYTDDSCRDSLWGDFSILMTAVGIVCGDDCSVY